MEQRLRDARHRPVAIALAAVCALVGAAAAPAPAARGHVTRPLILRPGPNPAVAEVPFALPPGSAQRKTGWYELRLRARVVFVAGRGRGNAYLSADTNGRTAAQIRFRSRGAREPVGWDAVGIIDGTQRGHFERSTEVVFRNFVQDRGIHGGANTLSFRVETLGRPGLDRVTVLPGSGVYRTPQGPARVALDVRQAGALRAGEPASLEVDVRNDGMRSARAIRVALDATPGLRASLEPHRPFALAPGEARTLRAKIGAERPGSYQLTVTGDSTSNMPATTVELRFDALPRRNVRKTIATAAVIGLGLLALVLLRGRRR